MMQQAVEAERVSGTVTFSSPGFFGCAAHRVSSFAQNDSSEICE
jgi:hypothetical protein